MTKRMLIDATHQEETRVVMLDGNRLEDVDFESASKRPIKGNVYLARVTRVEPSLQAAFVEYGGNRHGFLAFSEIHPDYYRIPVDDRPTPEPEEAEEEISGDAEPAESQADAMTDENGSEENGAAENGNGENGDDEGGEENVESLGGDEAEEVQARRPRNYRNYKIQEVIKRKQILLVQAVKEERGNKGAALTTYLSLPGRYCVLMPNTARGGGVSRKITNANDRKRIKQIVDDLDVPEGMAVIVRTAGSERSKAEIKRDFDYLMRLWEQIRNDTLSSVAPAMIYEEGSLIKRSLRDVYTSDVEEVLVDGDEGYKTAKDFMKSLIPSHARRIKKYKETDVPLFQRFQVESQLDAMHNPTVQLRSGGYLVINQTEALVAIDVNSGRATRERHIEETAVKTNLEAADEVARQLRLRDLAGLVVIDFIDMEENRHQNQVERRLKEAMKHDRARIQIGRISPFGLLEMSRQRLRPSLIESSAQQCSQCGGLGWVRSTESSGLQVLRAIEEEGTRKRAEQVIVTVPTRIALYLLNEKRAAVIQIEERYGIAVTVNADDSIIPPQVYKMERVKASGEIEIAEGPESATDGDEGGRGRRRRGGGGGRRGDRERGDRDRPERADRDRPERGDRGDRPERGDRDRPERGDREDRPQRSRRGRRAEIEEIEADETELEEAEETAAEEQTEAEDVEGDGEGQRKRRRRGRRGGRRRRGRRDEERTEEQAEDQTEDQTEDRAGQEAGDESGPAETAESETTESGGSESGGPESESAEPAQTESAATEATADIVIDAKAPADDEAATEGETEEKPKRKRATRSRKKAEEAPAEAEAAPTEEEEKPKRKRATRSRRKADAAPAEAETAGTGATEEEKPKPKRATRSRKKVEEAPVEAAPTEMLAEEALEGVAEPAPERVADAPAEEAQAEQALAEEAQAEPAPIAGESKPVVVEGTETEAEKPKRKGWWSRITGQ
ncbi:MAG: Rne/Rng family ribonuclease [Alphaproteobacteria bacterium]|nr:Rne/Rng family ribonuclease [Alphaproteobacteria bacterium]